MYGTATLSLLMIITRDEKRELLRARDRVAAEVFEVLHLVLREVPALVSYRREILVDGSRGFLSIGDAPLPGRVDCGWAHGAPIDVEARVHVGISVLALFAHHSCEPLFAGSNQTPATVVTINNITYLEGRGFLPHHPLHQHQQV